MHAIWSTESLSSSFPTPLLLYSSAWVLYELLISITDLEYDSLEVMALWNIHCLLGTNLSYHATCPRPSSAKITLIISRLPPTLLAQVLMSDSERESFLKILLKSPEEVYRAIGEIDSEYSLTTKDLDRFYLLGERAQNTKQEEFGALQTLKDKNGKEMTKFYEINSKVFGRMREWLVDLVWDKIDYLERLQVDRVYQRPRMRKRRRRGHREQWWAPTVRSGVDIASDLLLTGARLRNIN